MSDPLKSRDISPPAHPFDMGWQREITQAVNGLKNMTITTAAPDKPGRAFFGATKTLLQVPGPTTVYEYLEVYAEGDCYRVHTSYYSSSWSNVSVTAGTDYFATNSKWKIPTDERGYYFFVTNNVPPSDQYLDSTFGIILHTPATIDKDAKTYIVDRDNDGTLVEIVFDPLLISNSNDSLNFAAIDMGLLIQHQKGSQLLTDKFLAQMRNGGRSVNPGQISNPVRGDYRGLYFSNPPSVPDFVWPGDIVMTNDGDMTHTFVCEPLYTGAETAFVWANGALKTLISVVANTPDPARPIPTATNPWRLIGIAPQRRVNLYNGAYDNTKYYVRSTT